SLDRIGGQLGIERSKPRSLLRHVVAEVRTGLVASACGAFDLDELHLGGAATLTELEQALARGLELCDQLLQAGTSAAGAEARPAAGARNPAAGARRHPAAGARSCPTAGARRRPAAGARSRGGRSVRGKGCDRAVEIGNRLRERLVQRFI